MSSLTLRLGGIFWLGAMWIGVITYFLLGCWILAWVFLPPVRSRCAGVVTRLLVSGRSVMSMALQAKPAPSRMALTALIGSTCSFLRLHRIRIGCLLLAVLVPPLLSYGLRHRQDLGLQTPVGRAPNEQVAALLQGEQLVSPPPLPPDVFTTREVEQARPLIRYASRQWELLDDDFRQRLLWVFKAMKERHGYELVLLEGYRSPQRQAQLAALGGHVTHAGSYESYHQFGLAADVAFRRDGRVVISEADPWAMRAYERYGEVARSIGLAWGGDWRLKDYGHVEMQRPGVLRSPTQTARAGAARAS